MASTKSEQKKAPEGHSELFETAEAAGEKKSGLKKLITTEPKRQDSVYTVDEFCSNAQVLFHARPECIRAALGEKRVTQCTKEEAEKIVDAFMKKEVK